MPDDYCPDSFEPINEGEGGTIHGVQKYGRCVKDAHGNIKIVQIITHITRSKEEKSIFGDEPETVTLTEFDAKNLKDGAPDFDDYLEYIGRGAEDFQNIGTFERAYQMDRDGLAKNYIVKKFAKNVDAHRFIRRLPYRRVIF